MARELGLNARNLGKLANHRQEPVNGLAVDARHVPLDIQVEAFERGLIPYVPALGPDGTEAREGPGMAEPASAAAPSEEADLLEHCSELKRQLVEFACSRRFARQPDEAVSEGIGGTIADEGEFANLLERFIFQQPLADGRTAVEVFVAEHPELTGADCELLLGWRDVVEGVFEIRERAGDAIIATRLADGTTYPYLRQCRARCSGADAARVFHDRPDRPGWR
jgi:hypothetical protein